MSRLRASRLEDYLTRILELKLSSVIKWTLPFVVSKMFTFISRIYCSFRCIVIPKKDGRTFARLEYSSLGFLADRDYHVSCRHHTALCDNSFII